MCVYWNVVNVYVSFGSTVRPRTFVCVAMSSAVLFTLKSTLVVYSPGSGVNRVHVVLYGFSVRLVCFVQAKIVWMYGCMYFGCIRACVCRCDGDVLCVGHAMNRWSGWWYVCSVNVEYCWWMDATLRHASFELKLWWCVIYICCVGFVSLDVFCDERYDCAWNVAL